MIPRSPLAGANASRAVGRTYSNSPAHPRLEFNAFARLDVVALCIRPAALGSPGSAVEIGVILSQAPA